MPPVDRRSILLASASVPLTLAGFRATDIAMAAESAAPPEPTPPVAKDVTRTLARYIVEAKYDDLPPNVRKEGVRTLLNWVGVAIGGSHQPAVNIAVSALTPFSGPPQASLSVVRSGSIS